MRGWAGGGFARALFVGLLVLGALVWGACVGIADGHVYSFGDNYYGQLGHGDGLSRHAPTKIAALEDVIAIAAGYDHNLILLVNGDVYSWGRNCSGQLGHGDTELFGPRTPTKIESLPGPAVSVAAGYRTSAVVLANGDVYTFGENYIGQLGHGDTASRSTPTKIAALLGVSAVGGWGQALTGSHSAGCPADAGALGDASKPECGGFGGDGAVHRGQHR